MGGTGVYDRLHSDRIPIRYGVARTTDDIARAIAKPSVSTQNLFSIAFLSPLRGKGGTPIGAK